MTYKAIDLFAGIGGIWMGFDNAFGKEIETDFVCEWDKYAQKTYRENYCDSFEIAGDLRTFHRPHTFCSSSPIWQNDALFLISG